MSVSMDSEESMINRLKVYVMKSTLPYAALLFSALIYVLVLNYTLFLYSTLLQINTFNLISQRIIKGKAHRLNSVLSRSFAAVQNYPFQLFVGYCKNVPLKSL